MTCREVEKLFDLFLDNELEARAMRAVALHVTRCPECEHALQRVERVQDIVADTFAEAVANVDFTQFWPAVEARAGSFGRYSFTSAVRNLAARAGAFAVHPLASATATVALAALFALALWRGMLAPGGIADARIDNQVRIDSLVSEADSVTLLSEPRTNTTVIWVENAERSR